MKKVYGTIEADVFTVVSVHEEQIIYGLSGDDVFLLTGHLYDYQLDGGKGIDTIKLAADVIVGGFNVNGAYKCEVLDFNHMKLTGMVGRDDFDFSKFTVIGQTKSVDLVGGPDGFIGSSANDNVNGGDGNDDLRGALGDDILSGGNDYDTLHGDSGADILDGGNGNDIIYGGAGDDLIYGGAGNDQLYGDSGLDKVWAGSGNDTIYVKSLEGAKLVQGQKGTDTLVLDIGHGVVEQFSIGDSQSIEYLNINSGFRGNKNDNLFDFGNVKGFVNAIILDLFGGKDIYIGCAGDDYVDGGSGNDILTGGSGNDVFFFSSKLNAKTNVDVITDFDVNHDDLRLSSDIFQNFNWHYWELEINTTGKATQMNSHVIYESDTGNLYYDADGNGSHAAVLFSKLDPHLALTIDNFFLN